MRNLILLLSIGLLYASCTKEVLVEVPVTNPVNTQLQSQITQLQNTISNLTTTNTNLESQISLLESEADILQGEIDAQLMTLEDAQESILGLVDIVEDLRADIETYNIEQERASEESFFRLSFTQTAGQQFITVGSFDFIQIGRWDHGPQNDVIAWFEDRFGLDDGKEVSYSLDGNWNNGVEVRNFYNSDGELHLSIGYKFEDGVRVERNFYVAAYDYIYQLEDAINEYLTTN